jgi:hypothetical protein
VFLWVLCALKNFEKFKVKAHTQLTQIQIMSATKNILRAGLGILKCHFWLIWQKRLIIFFFLGFRLLRRLFRLFKNLNGVIILDLFVSRFIVLLCIQICGAFQIWFLVTFFDLANGILLITIKEVTLDKIWFSVSVVAILTFLTAFFTFELFT